MKNWELGSLHRSVGRCERSAICKLGLVLAFAVLLAGVPAKLRAQEVSAPDSTQANVDIYENEYTGHFAPGTGFDLIRTERGSLNLSMYGLFRYLNQMPGEQTFEDHLGRTRTVKTRNDLNWHRSFVWLTGFFYNPRFRYNLSIWSLPTTQQTLVFGNLRFVVSRRLTVAAGLGPNLTNRSMQGSWPFWAGSDRQMAEDGMRGGFSSTFFLTGEPFERFYYTAAVTNNLSQLGVTASNDTRDLGYSASLWWMPTTGEFGPRGGFGDLEEHQELATRFGISAAHSRENRYAQLSSPPNATQIRLSDGVFPFEEGALADSVTVNYLDYDIVSLDAGFKLKGFAFQGEYSIRNLSNFEAIDVGTLSETELADDSIVDHAFYVQAGQMVVEKKLLLYAVGSYFFDEFERNPYEIGGGVSYYPYGSRSWRLNLHLLHVDRSGAGSNFGYYTAGQTGTILSIGTDILL